MLWVYMRYNWLSVLLPSSPPISADALFPGIDDAPPLVRLISWESSLASRKYQAFLFSKIWMCTCLSMEIQTSPKGNAGTCQWKCTCLEWKCRHVLMLVRLPPVEMQTHPCSNADPPYRSAGIHLPMELHPLPKVMQAPPRWNPGTYWDLFMLHFWRRQMSPWVYPWPCERLSYFQTRVVEQVSFQSFFLEDSPHSPCGAENASLPWIDVAVVLRPAVASLFPAPISF